MCIVCLIYIHIWLLYGYYTKANTWTEPCFHFKFRFGFPIDEQNGGEKRSYEINAVTSWTALLVYQSTAASRTACIPQCISRWARLAKHIGKDFIISSFFIIKKLILQFWIVIKQYLIWWFWKHIAWGHSERDSYPHNIILSFKITQLTE